MKKLIAASLLVLTSSVYALALEVSDYSVTEAILATAQTVTFPKPVRVITIKTSAPTSSAIHVTFDGTTATTSNFTIDGNGSGYTRVQQNGDPDIPSISVIGDSASGNFSVEAYK